ncbi:MAG: LamG domain-containing protein [bacterium]
MKGNLRPVAFIVGMLLACEAVWSGSLTTDNLTVNQQSTLSGQVAIGPVVLSTNAVPTNNYVVMYTFDTNTTPVADGSTNGNSGTVTNATWTNGGKIGGAYVFDGSNSFISASDSASLDIRAALTISGWARFDSASSLRMLVAKHDDSSQRAYDLYFDNGALYCQVSSSGSGSAHYSFNTAGDVSSATWTHYVVTWDGTANSNGRIYVNGASQTVQTASATFSGTNIFNSSMPFRVGAKSNGGWYFAGAIDDVRVYDYALSEGDVLALYQSGVGTITQSLTVDASVPTTLSGTTTITRLVKQGDVEMGVYTNGP